MFYPRSLNISVFSQPGLRNNLMKLLLRTGRSIIYTMLLIILVSCSLEDSSNPAADDVVLSWDMQDRCFDGSAIQLRFFEAAGGSRTGRVWPGGDRVYVLSGSDTYNLSCRAGTDVCYGAQPRDGSSGHWGLDITGQDGCTNCCSSCSSVTVRRSLSC